MRRIELKRTAASLALVAAAYAVYVYGVAPWVEPSIRPRRSAPAAETSSATKSAADRYRDQLEGLFPAGAWENDSPKVLCHRNTLVLFRDYQPQSDGTIHVYPCTVVLHPAGQQANGSALVLQAPEGAVLQLNRAIDLRSGQLGQPIAGRLIGQIEVRSPGRSDGQGRLKFLTRDVHMNSKQLWTTQEVEFQYESSHARGRDLMVKLVPLTPGGRGGRRGGGAQRGWAGIRSVELVQLDHLHLNVEGSGGAADARTPIDVTCRGPLRIDFFENRLTLDDDVKLRRQSRSGVMDEVQCDQLTLMFRPQPAPKNVASAALPTGPTDRATRPPTQPAMVNAPKLELTRVVAVGDPVIVEAASRKTRLRGRRLLYDLEQGRFRMWPRTADPLDQVWLQQEQHEIQTRELDCQLDANSNLKAARLQGPGSFRGSLRGSDPQPVSATWHGSLVFAEDAPQHQLTLKERAKVGLGDHDGLEAETIHVWFESAPRILARAGAAPSGTLTRAMDLRPQRIVALPRSQQQPVILRSQGIVARTQRLEADFVHRVPTPAPLRALPRTPDRAGASAAPRQSRPTRLPGIASVGGREDADRRRARADSSEDTLIEGQSLVAVLGVEGDTLVLDQLQLNDKVVVKRLDQSDPAKAFELMADAVTVRQPEGVGSEQMEAWGQPLRIRSERIRLATDKLQLDRHRNRMSTDRPGQMVILVDRDAEGRRLRRPQPVTVDWSQRMDFNGQRARFGGDVDVRAPGQRLRSENMAVDLNQYISLQDGIRKQGQTLDLERVQAEGSVRIESQQYEREALTSLLYLQAPFAEWNRSTGAIRATGPGRVVTLRDGFRGNLELRGRTQTHPVARTSRTPEKTFLQVDYQGEIQGNLTHRLVRFQQRIQVVYGPVLSWNERIRSEAPLRRNDVLLSCDRLTVSQSPRSELKGGVELAAEGNTFVEGQTFTASGQRVSFDQSKDLLVLEGTPSMDAVLSHQARVGATRSKTEARKILYWTRTKRVELDDARYLDLSNLAR